MNCPRCNSELRIGERKGIEIDYCVSCRGIWLDSGELDKIIDRSQFGGNNQNDQRSNQQDDESWWERILDVFD